MRATKKMKARRQQSVIGERRGIATSQIDLVTSCEGITNELIYGYTKWCFGESDFIVHIAGEIRYNIALCVA